MAGGCPGYGSGISNAGNASARSMSTAATQKSLPHKMRYENVEEEERAFRDEYYKFWETSMM